MERMNHWMAAVAAALAAAWLVALAGCTFEDLPMRKGIEDLGYSWKQVATFRGDGLAADQFGCSVAISGDWAAVGCCGEGTGGAVYLFQNSGGTWSRMQKISGTVSNGYFGVSVAIDGNYLIVGAPEEVATKRGAAHVYELSGGVWGEPGITLTWSAAADNAKMGISVAIDDEWAFVGAPYAATSTGTVYAYYRGSGPWTTAIDAAQLKLSSGISGDYFGWSIGLSGSHAVIGCPMGIGGGKAGAAYVYDLVGSYWGDGSGHPTTSLAVADSDSFGTSVSIAGDMLVVGSPGNESAYIYERSGTAWNGTRIFNPRGASGDLFGTSVGLSDTHVIVGSIQNDQLGTDRGNAYPFESNGYSWSMESDLVPSDAAAYSQLGVAAAVSGDYSIVAAYNGSTPAGVVYIFKRGK